MRVLITGVTGFVGQYLFRALDVDESVDLSLLVRTPLQQNLFVSKKKSTIVTVKSITQSSDWSDVFIGVDKVIHLAAQAHTETFDKTTSYDTNVLGTIRLMEAASQSGVSQFIYLSSIKVLGEASAKPFTDTDLPCPDLGYPTTKFEAEEALKAICEFSAMNYTILRPPIIYGKECGDNFKRLVKLVRLGLPMPFANVQNRRSYIYVENVVSAIITCMKNTLAYNKTYLIHDLVVSTPELMNLIASYNNRSARLFPFPEPWLRFFAGLFGKKELLRRFLDSLEIDSDFIKRDLGWAPPFLASEGFDKTLKDKES